MSPEELRQARERARWGLLRALEPRPIGAPLSALAERWRTAAATIRSESKDFDDEADTLEQCARELLAWLEAEKA